MRVRAADCHLAEQDTASSPSLPRTFNSVWWFICWVKIGPHYINQAVLNSVFLPFLISAGTMGEFYRDQLYTMLLRSKFYKHSIWDLKS